MKAKTVFIIAGTAAVGTALYFLVIRKGTLSSTGPSYQLPPITGSGTPGIGSPAGKQAYTSQGNVILRTSAQTNDPTLWIFGGNVGVTITNAATWVGTVIAAYADADTAINPATGMAYNWYLLKLSSTVTASYSLDSSVQLYIREDFVTLK